jgi:anhydro-N-acetylmuramic acid kinase
MIDNIQNLYATALKNKKLILGLMSGTSLDGLDLALCSIENSGLQTKVEVLKFTTVVYTHSFKNEIKSIFSKQMVDLEKVCLLNRFIADTHANIINETLQQWNIENSAVDIIASHGQTIYHAPKFLHQQPNFNTATLQIGDGDHIAVRTGIITISDFRQKHIAAGGEGAPLAVYGDYLLFNNDQENRIMLNIGGIANFTFLPKHANVASIFSTDTGPGNGLMDIYIQQHFEEKYFDKNSLVASQGTVNAALLLALKNNSFFQQAFPKTIGPELFNLHYILNAQKKSNTQNLSIADVMATLNKFSADTIKDAIVQYTNNKAFTIYTSGGGKHNPLLMQHLQQQLNNCSFKEIEDIGIHPDAKEAVLFAVLANETLSGNSFSSTNLMIPSISMGKISLPS